MTVDTRDVEPSHSRLFAALVHIYTASGALLAFIGVRAVLRNDDRLAFVAMFLATAIDSTDGLLARRARVKDVLPQYDGARIDDIVDYLTFVFLPMLLIERSGGLPAGLALPIVGIVLVSSAFGFSASDAKTADHYFTGFPSYWNIVVFYLYVFRMPPAVNAIVLVALSAMIFVRVRYIYPSRTPIMRRLTVTIGCAWAVTVALLIWQLAAPPRWLAILSLVFPVYYTVMSFVLHAQSRQVHAA
jgi:phosphatidylcholine synthase